MMMNSALASLQVLWLWAACISLHTFQRTLRVSGCRGQRTYRRWRSWRATPCWAGGGHWGYPIPQYRKKKVAKPCQKSTKYQYRIYFRSSLLKVKSISHVCLSQPFMHQQSTSAITRKRETTSNWSAQRSKRVPYQFHHRISVRNCVIIYHYSKVQ